MISRHYGPRILVVAAGIAVMILLGTVLAVGAAANNTPQGLSQKPLPGEPFVCQAGESQAVSYLGQHTALTCVCRGHFHVEMQDGPLSPTAWEVCD